MIGSQMHYIALVANEPLALDIASFKEEVLETFGCRAAMKSPAHITLIPPFYWSRGMQKILNDTFHGFRSSISEIIIHVNGFGHFRRNVIFATPEYNERLMQLQKECIDYFRPLLGDKIADKRPFHPHITIANRDLKSEDFDQAWEMFRNRPYKRDWHVNTLSLLQHDGICWQVIEELNWYRK
jgi:2'-5' RNA ligase